MHREDKNFGIRNCLYGLTRCLDSIQFGHADVEYGDIRFQFYCLFYRLTTIRGFTYDSPAVSGVEDRPCTTAHQPVVVGDQNAKFFHFRSLPRGIVTRTVVPRLEESISSQPPISFTRSCMLGMPTPTWNRGSSFPFCTLAESPRPKSLISNVRCELRVTRILAC